MDQSDPVDVTLPVEEDCRLALLAFLDGSEEAWDAARLAWWLGVHYARCTSRVPREERDAPRGAAVDGEALDLVVSGARARVFDRMWELSTEGRCDFVWDAVHDGLVVSVDVDGEQVFLPRDRARGRLVDRVLSLLAVDYLTRPWSYEDGRVCGLASLDGLAPGAGDAPGDAEDADGAVPVHMDEPVPVAAEVLDALVDPRAAFDTWYDISIDFDDDPAPEEARDAASELALESGERRVDGAPIARIALKRVPGAG
jgi:hypothetical protein